ncbi:hypothetical protein DH2020_024315 [Rehmannia glutinosa]|uniref:CCHC-type domain-containing protein n=1 Tax=Rehmannia glutinosa TaxID=99300 RepID=A0ABR0W6P2_REHGL
MAGIEKQKFQILDTTGENYLSWCLDIKLHLQGQDLAKTLKAVKIEEAVVKDEANAMIFIRHHLSDDLKNEYIQIERPSEIWQKLKERFDHTRTVILPQAQYDWQHLRLQDFKSVADYNSALFKIESRLALCGTKLSEYDKLEKTFSTMHKSNIVLQQQYRQRQFKTYSCYNIISSTEKTNELLLRNHDLRPSGFNAVPEAHVNSGRGGARFRGRGGRRGRGRGGPHENTHRFDSGGRNYYNQDNYHYSRQNNYNAKQGHQNQSNRDKEKIHMERSGDDLCHRCGMTGHWAKTCRTARHLVKLYQESKKNKGKSVQTHAHRRVRAI